MTWRICPQLLRLNGKKIKHVYLDELFAILLSVLCKQGGFASHHDTHSVAHMQVKSQHSLSSATLAKAEPLWRLLLE